MELRNVHWNKKIECLQCKSIDSVSIISLIMIVLLIWFSFNLRKILFWSTIFVSAYSDLKFCPSVLHAPVIPLLPHNSRNSSLFTANYKILHQLDIFLLLTVCVQIVDNIWKHVIFQKKFCSFISNHIYFLVFKDLPQHLILIFLPYWICLAHLMFCFCVFVFWFIYIYMCVSL